MKFFFIILMLVTKTFFAFSQTEEQRKYVFRNINEEIIRTVSEGAILDGLSIKKHSIYEYFDIYLDTDSLDLLNKKLSLRIRKRDFGNGKTEYGIQLKSEMLNPGDIRMEIDESELDYLSVYFDNQELKLITVIETIFKRYQNLLESSGRSDVSSDPVILENTSILKAWLEFKVNGSIAPFQKLRRLGIDEKKLKTLKPYIIGRSMRTRSHVFIDRAVTASELSYFPQSSRSQKDTPLILQGDDRVWTMEASFDQARFHGLLELNAAHDINEFEVENKYLPNEMASVILERFENALIKKLGAEVNLESKYLQTMSALGYHWP